MRLAVLPNAFLVNMFKNIMTVAAKSRANEQTKGTLHQKDGHAQRNAIYMQASFRAEDGCVTQ
jgi:hypothetical protein